MTRQFQTTDEAVDAIFQQFNDALAKQLAQQVENMEAINQASIMQQKFAGQQVIMKVMIRQRLRLQADLENAKACPILQSFVAQQIREMDDSIIQTMTESGIPEKVAQKQIALHIEQHSKPLEVVDREDNGRIKRMTKQTG